MIAPTAKVLSRNYLILKKLSMSEIKKNCLCVPPIWKKNSGSLMIMVMVVTIAVIKNDCNGGNDVDVIMAIAVQKNE